MEQNQEEVKSEATTEEKPKKTPPRAEDLFEKIDTSKEKEPEHEKSVEEPLKNAEDEEKKEPKEEEDPDTPRKNNTELSKKQKRKKEVVEEEKKGEIPNALSTPISETIQKISTLVYDCLYDDAFAMAKQLRESESFDFNALSRKEQNIIVDVEETFKHVEEVGQYLNDEEGWSTDSSNATVTTKFKKYPNSNNYTMKMEGELNFPIENMMSIVYEIEYFNEFVPFCNQSYSIRKISKGAKLCYFMLDIPFWSNREGYIRGFGVDRIKKNNTLLIISKTIDDDKPLLERLEFDIPPNDKCVRLKMDHFCFEVTPITRTKFKLRSLLNLEPKVAYVPQFVLNFFSRKIGAHMFSKLIYLAENMSDKKWEDVRKKEESKEFYAWIDQRIEEVEKRKQLEQEKSEAPVRI